MSVQPYQIKPALPLPPMPFAGGLGDTMQLFASVQQLWWNAAAKAQMQRFSFLAQRCERAGHLPMALAASCPAGEMFAVGRDYAEVALVDYVNEMARCAEAESRFAAEAAAEIRKSVRTLTKDLAAQAVCP